MKNHQVLANSVVFNKKNRLVSCDPSLKLIGTGRSAFVFKVNTSDKAIKVFFPDCAYIATKRLVRLLKAR